MNFDEEVSYELMQRNCFCRCCHKSLKRNVHKGIKFYTNLSGGHTIILCPDCVGGIFGRMIKEDLSEKYEAEDNTKEV